MSHGFEYRVKAIPTLFNGVYYRSRLEAKWAAYFTLLRWEFIYEPFDLDGWIPDFMIKGPTDILVEVKPYYKNEHFRTEAENILRRHPTFSGDILLVGNTTHPLNSVYDKEVFEGYNDFYDKIYDLDTYCTQERSVILGWLASNNWEYDYKTGLRKPSSEFLGVKMTPAILGQYESGEYDFCKYGRSDIWNTVRHGKHIRDEVKFNQCQPDQDLHIARQANRLTQYKAVA